MPQHEYTAEYALDLLMKKLTERSPELARQIQDVVDHGKDAGEQERPPGGKKSRRYRKTVPYSYGEALNAALDALGAHFIQQPLIINSACEEMREAAVGNGSSSRGFGFLDHFREQSAEAKGQQKSIEIELVTETQVRPLAPAAQETYPLKETSEAQVEEQKQHLAKLRALFDFRE